MTTTSSPPDGDIMFSVAERCDDDDCPSEWHIAHYWAYSDGTFSVCDSDGNHDEIDEEDLPKYEEVDQSWKDYAAFVAETGADPLGNFMVKSQRKVKQRWQFKFNRSIIGPVLLAARRRGVEVEVERIPAPVLDYLTIDPTKHARSLTAFPTCADFEAVIKPSQWGKWVAFTVEVTEDRPMERVKAELRRMARHALKAPRHQGG